MEFRLEKGNKHIRDMCLLVKTSGWEKITYSDVIRIVKELMDNEDRIYPPPYAGRDRLYGVLRKVWLKEEVDPSFLTKGTE